MRYDPNAARVCGSAHECSAKAPKAWISDAPMKLDVKNPTTVEAPLIAAAEACTDAAKASSLEGMTTTEPT